MLDCYVRLSSWIVVLDYQVGLPCFTTMIENQDDSFRFLPSTFSLR